MRFGLHLLFFLTNWIVCDEESSAGLYFGHVHGWFQWPLCQSEHSHLSEFQRCSLGCPHAACMATEHVGQYDQSVSGLRATSEGQIWRTACESPAEPEMSLEVQKEKSLSLFISIETEKVLWLENRILCHLFIRSLLENVSLLSDLKKCCSFVHLHLTSNLVLRQDQTCTANELWDF